MLVFFSGQLLHVLHAFTEFTDQQCHVLNSSSALLILMHAAIQVVYCHYMLTPFVECL